MNDLVYRLCPAVSDVRPSDDDIDVVVDAIGLTMVAQRADARPDGAQHFIVTLKIADRTMKVPYSMGSALKGDPTIADVIYAVISDIDSVDGLTVDSESDFSQWCEEFGYDVDSRTAHQAYCACIAARDAFATLMGEAVSESEFSDLRDICD